MSFSFIGFSRCSGEDYALLKRRIDACAAAGRSYELPGCHMAEGCFPAECTVCFWCNGGVYFLYWKPAIQYRGQDPKLAGLFRHCIYRFTSFEQLRQCLCGISAPPSAADGPPLFRRIRTALGGTILGQEAAVEAVSFKLYGHVGKARPARPLSLILYGPTGVGKSELGKCVARTLNELCQEERYRFVWTELNTFTEAHSVYRLTGAPPGYVGYDDSPIFEAVRHNPYTVFMFDELEKAHPEVLKVFMSILDEGRCVARKENPDGTRALDFTRCIFLFTTNADLSVRANCRLGFAAEPAADGSDPCRNGIPAACGDTYMAELAHRVFRENENARQAMVRSGVLKEIAGRFGGIIGFQPLDRAARTEITARQIAALGREYGLQIVRVDPGIAAAFTPEDAASVRSTVTVLEGMMTPFFLSQAEQQNGVKLALAGEPASMRLVPA